ILKESAVCEKIDKKISEINNFFKYIPKEYVI
ncbi:unnamed protein product, partial [marine sediment metagenome]